MSDGRRRIGRGAGEAHGQPARAAQMERARGLDGRRSPRRFRRLSGELPSLAQDAARRRSRSDLRSSGECLPKGDRPAAAGFGRRARLLRTEFSARPHRAPGRSRRTPDRLFRANRRRLALPQPRIPRPALPPPRDLVADGYKPGSVAFPNKGARIGRRNGNNELVPYHDRGAIEAGALDGQKLEICWIKDPLDLLTIQIEGSARVILEDGTPLRVSYDSHNGYSYSSVERAF